MVVPSGAMVKTSISLLATSCPLLMLGVVTGDQASVAAETGIAGAYSAIDSVKLRQI